MNFASKLRCCSFQRTVTVSSLRSVAYLTTFPRSASQLASLSNYPFKHNPIYALRTSSTLPSTEVHASVPYFSPKSIHDHSPFLLRGSVVNLSPRRHFGEYGHHIIGKRVLITGASRGIGRHIALEYARLGANIVITARDEASLADVADECRKVSAASSSIVECVVGVQGSPEEAASLIAEATALLGGGLDLLFLNHGLSAQSAWKGTKEQFDAADQAMRVNYFSQMYLGSAALPLLKVDGGGTIVVVNSASARSAMPAFSYYGASKAAMATFFRSLRLELQQSKEDVAITVCTLGLVKTERNVGKETSSLAFRLGAEPEEAAAFMVKSAALRKPEVKYPLKQFIIKDIMDSLPRRLKTIVMKRVVPQSH